MVPTGKLFLCMQAVMFSSSKAVPRTRWRSNSIFAPFISGDRRRQIVTRHARGIQFQLHSDVVSSTKSTTVKKYRGLLSKRRDRTRLAQTVVEGPRIIFDMLSNPGTASLVRQILVSTDDFEEHYQKRLEAASSPIMAQLATPAIIKACSDTVTPQGIVALVDLPDLEPQYNQSHPLFLVLDGVSDPGNVGTLLRSALAVGVAGVILLPECCDVWSPKTIRSAMGASFQLPIKQVSSWSDAQSLLKRWQVERIYPATMVEGSDVCEGSKPHYDVNWSVCPSALVIGNEGRGLSEEVRGSILSTGGHDDGLTCRAIHVPMQSGIESLNAAICGSVILFEYLRQCKVSP